MLGMGTGQGAGFELRITSWVEAQGPGRLSGSRFQPDGSGQGSRDGTQLFQGVLGACADSSSLVTCQFPRRTVSAGGARARVRSERAAEAMGLGEVGASRARPRHTLDRHRRPATGKHPLWLVHLPSTTCRDCWALALVQSSSRAVLS